MSAKILVVDDESGMRRSLGIMLRREGYAVTEAPGGPEAADLLGRDVYDLVIADLRMEQLSGIDLLRLVIYSAEPRNTKETSLQELIDDIEVPDSLTIAFKLKYPGLHY